MRAFIRVFAAAILLAPAAASAHTGIGDTDGLVHGFLHPIGGLDHVLAMLAAGLFAAHLGGRGLWLVPASLICLMSAGGALGLAGVPIPFVEIGIATSVIVIGAAVALQINLPTLVAMGLVGFFAVFHGHAHGVEMPETASGLAYGAGFIAATSLLHATGIGLGLAIGRLGTAYGGRVMQASGTAIALAGLGLLTGYL